MFGGEEDLKSNSYKFNGKTLQIIHQKFHLFSQLLHKAPWSTQNYFNYYKIIPALRLWEITINIKSIFHNLLSLKFFKNKTAGNLLYINNIKLNSILSTLPLKPKIQLLHISSIMKLWDSKLGFWSGLPCDYLSNLDWLALYGITLCSGISLLLSCRLIVKFLLLLSTFWNWFGSHCNKYSF